MRSTTTNRSQFRHPHLKTLRSILFCLALSTGSQALFAQSSSTNPLVRFHTDLGDIDLALLKDIAPNNVANFLGYVNPGTYDNSFIHRSVPTFIVQGGGYTFVNNQPTALAQHAAVVNEFHVSNKRGTLAMAKIAGNPNSATNQWFFNESDSNASNLDNQNGGFSVFGRIINNTGLTTMDAIAAVPIFNAQGVFGSDFQSLPLRNYTSGAPQDANLVHVISGQGGAANLGADPSLGQHHSCPGHRWSEQKLPAANFFHPSGQRFHQPVGGACGCEREHCL